jgi:RNA polymerase sigma-70 factor (ECF subfamily)
MPIINLREIYPDFYNTDSFVDVPAEVAETVYAGARQERSAERKKYRHQAHYSLDRGDGIEHEILFLAKSPDEIYEKKLTRQQLYAAISQLPEKQAKRIYAYYFMDMDEPVIASAEGVSHQAVHASLQRGLKGIEKYLKTYF